MISFDAVVIGAGHNGLTLAAYLSRAGLRVGVLERNAHVGGGCTTEEAALPGYRFNLHSNFYMGFGRAPLVKDLELYRYGFSFIEPPVQQATTFRDGTCAVIHKDIEATVRSLSRFSPADARRFRELYELYGVKMRPLLTSLRYNAPLDRATLQDRLSGPEGREYLSNAQYDIFGVIGKHFEHDRIKTLFASYMHVGTVENGQGAGAIFPGVFANLTGFTLPVSGSSSFTAALSRVVEEGGGAVITGAHVREIRVHAGRATGVVLDTGAFVEGRKLVASSIDAPTTMRISGEEHYPDEVRQKLNNWYWGNHSVVTLHLALRDAPVYRSAAFDPDIARAFNIYFGMDDTEQLISSFEDCEANRFPSVLLGNGACNSKFDPSYSPADGQVAFWWPFVPYDVDGNCTNWDERRAEYSQRILDYWRQYAANLDDDNIRARFLFTPRDIERLNVNMVRGAARMGAWVPSQLGVNRPHPILSGTRTPIEGLYLCGSSSGNGGGLNGAPGYIAANAVVDDLRLERTWTPVPPPEWRH
jgi:phytoene dehydrogenase-like protein